ncbi:ATP-dependent zinc protease [Dokdonella ginsengisoli]|uniref:ATP-dependent zinc protease n=1 Tax=Dokdonella ginsengisoli TaxID=363846 RepID=A0ABV9QUS5_9GAMM
MQAFESPDPSATSPPLSLGWREWLSLPALGIPSIKAKLDTGARSSALHVEALHTFRRDGVLLVRFDVRPRRRGKRLFSCEAAVVDRRTVTDSGGHRAERWFIQTEVELAGTRFVTEINLTDRRAMLFPLLLGRSALCGRFGVDAALSYSCPRPSRIGRIPT